MKKIVFLILLIFGFLSANFAQQLPQYSHFMFFNSGINPGNYGMEGQICANIISHDQWIGWDNAPKTRTLSLDMPLDLFGFGHGIGLFLESDILGFENNFTAKAGYSFHPNLPVGSLGIGFNAGIYNKSFEEGGWSFPDIDESDIFSNIKRKMILDVDLGIFYTLNNLSVGAAVKHLNRGKLEFSETGDYQLKNHFVFNAGYRIPLSNDLIDLTPSVLVKTDITTTQYDFNLHLLYNKKFWGGVTYRNNDAIVFFAGGKIYNSIKLGLAYDLTISRIQTVSNGTFEVYVGYSFELIKIDKEKKYSRVRFL